MKILLMMAIVLGAGCKKTNCTETTTNMTGAGARFDFKSCSDNKDRNVSCELTGTHWSCTCNLDNAKGRTFQLPSNGMVSNNLVTFDTAKDNCDW
jgi:hypothetical protein